MTKTLFALCVSGALLMGCEPLPTTPDEERVEVEAEPRGLEVAPLDCRRCEAIARPAADGGYAKLSDTGLYCDIVAGTIDHRARPYRPSYSLWADGAEKRRFLMLPQGSQIDSTDMDNWKFPVGTKLWKEFGIDGKKLETRLLEKRPDGKWYMMAFVWNADETEALPAPNGQANINGTDHDAPSLKECGFCHGNAADTVLGVAALQLPWLSWRSVSLLSLIGAGELTVNPTEPPRLPGHALDRAALGYLGANCANCHRGPKAPAGLDLSTSVHDTDVAKTKAYLTSVNQKLVKWVNHGYTMRSVPGQPEQSALIARMATRVAADEMPKVGSKHVDERGVALLKTWVRRLK